MHFFCTKSLVTCLLIFNVISYNLWYPVIISFSLNVHDYLYYFLQNLFLRVYLWICMVWCLFDRFFFLLFLAMFIYFSCFFYTNQNSVCSYKKESVFDHIIRREASENIGEHHGNWEDLWKKRQGQTKRNDAGWH